MANADTLEGAGVNSGNALDAAKLQNNSETAKFKAKYFYDFLNIPAASPFSVNQIIQTTDAEVSTWPGLF